MFVIVFFYQDDLIIVTMFSTSDYGIIIQDHFPMDSSFAGNILSFQISVLPSSFKTRCLRRRVHNRVKRFHVSCCYICHLLFIHLFSICYLTLIQSTIVFTNVVAVVECVCEKIFFILDSSQVFQFSFFCFV